MISELERLRDFKNKIESKLNNVKFMTNASRDVIGLEKKKLGDFEMKIKNLEFELNNLYILKNN